MASEKTTSQAEPPSIDFMYQVSWVQKLLGQIKDCLRRNSDWLGPDASKPQRILDYGCGNGTVSSALLATFPLAAFRGIDVLDAQVRLYNDEASRILGSDHRDRMSAIRGDLHEPHKTPILDNPEWFGFDSLVISFVLHHVNDPIGTLELLKARVRPGGTVVVVDWIKEEDKQEATARGVPQNTGGERKYNPINMLPVPMGRVWPGFSLRDIREDYEAAGLTDVDVRIWPEKIELPQMATFGGPSTLYISKATVPSP